MAETKPKLEKSVVLVGLMGAGKTSVGRRLASRLGVSFVDADAEIETAAGRTITEIFETHGEAAFRDGERRVIARLLNDQPGVLGTGGGAFLDPETRAKVAEKGISIWLRADLDVLTARCARRNNRPLLWQGDPREILGYAEADIVVDSVNGPHEAVVDKIIKALAARDKASATDTA